MSEVIHDETLFLFYSFCTRKLAINYLLASLGKGYNQLYIKLPLHYESQYLRKQEKERWPKKTK